MASHWIKMGNELRRASMVGVLALAAAICSQSTLAQPEAQPEASVPQTYDWSAELVSFDQESAAVTLKARMDTRVDKAALGELSEGDPITITWTGLNWGAGIAAVNPEGAAEETGRLHLPAEFAGTELDDAYLLFRVQVPEDAASSIGSLEAGSWVTATTPRDAAEAEEAVSTIRPYNDVS